LFSNAQIARFINRNFEPMWESVRAVPTIKIDFGNGNVVTRTLNGNVATYACQADGQVLDILPGIYDPDTYLRQLEELTKLHRFVMQRDDHAAALREYHQQQADTLKQHGRRAIFVGGGGGMSITGVERPLKLLLVPAKRAAARHAIAEGREPIAESESTPKSAEDLRDWKALAEDSRINEATRRQKIHERLVASENPVQPADLTKWLYREILHADLDDPYLGLGKLLFESYPFINEDQR